LGFCWESELIVGFRGYLKEKVVFGLKMESCFGVIRREVRQDLSFKRQPCLYPARLRAGGLIEFHGTTQFKSIPVIGLLEETF
jgi:hypothetical protein